ncbi:hypothetical protein [Mycoplasma leonicaptivi]|uniref:hypothetical protein n=1 Tax=Mycoplasma leonicaptivi TaxID=36742 RepID=UPI000487DF45|nr:hypothetical protein [Mycoplasma leonicaptivi]
MEQIKSFFSLKNIKKILSLLLGFILFGITFGLVLYKNQVHYKPAFFNYKSYMEEDNISKINENFSYKTFNEVDEFTVALNNGKAAGGIGSDYQVISLIKKNLLKPINFNVLLNLKEPLKNKDELKEKLKKIYTPLVFKHLESYDSELTTDFVGQEFKEPRHLWEYFVPYYSQDGVVAYNSLKNQNSNLSEIDFSDYESNLEKLKKNNEYTNFDDVVKENSLFNILNTIKNNGYSKLTITDATRVNMLYGSAYIFDNQSKLIRNIFNQNTSFDNYKVSTKGFIDLIEKSRNQSISNNDIIFNGDGQDIIRSLLDPSRKDVDSAIMYNGDALDAYYSEDNGLKTLDYDGNSILIPDGTVKVKKFKNNILLVDGFILANALSESTELKMYDVLRNTIFSNIESDLIFNTTNDFITDLYDKYLNIEIGDYITKRIGVESFNIFKNELISLYKETIDETLSDDLLEKFEIFIINKVLNNVELKEGFEEFLKVNEIDSIYSELSEEEKKLKEEVLFEFNEEISKRKETLRNIIWDLPTSSNKDYLHEKLNNIKSNYSFEPTDSLLNRVLFEYKKIKKPISVSQFKNPFIKNKNKKDLLEKLKNNNDFIKKSALVISRINLDSEKLSNLLLEKYRNITNWQAINYTPSINAEYQIIKRNHFVKDDNTFDKKAIEIYEIKSGNGYIIHGKISGVDDKLQSILNSYYYVQIKH